jgi:hypothetical protein
MEWLNSWSESVMSLSNEKIGDLPLQLPLRGVSGHGDFVVVAEAEVFFGLRADEAGAIRDDGLWRVSWPFWPRVAVMRWGWLSAG